LSKLIVLLIVVVLVLWLFRGLGRKARARRRAGSRPAEDMVRCAQCGVHLPRSESLTRGAAFFCSAEHRREHETVH
jgi:uncharacterized protein